MFEELISSLENPSSEEIEKIMYDAEDNIQNIISKAVVDKTIIDEELDKKKRDAINSLAKLALQADASFAASLSNKIDKLNIEIEEERRIRKEKVEEDKNTNIREIQNKLKEDKETVIKNTCDKLFSAVFREISKTQNKIGLIKKSYKQSLNSIKTAINEHSNEIIELELLHLNNNITLLNKLNIELIGVKNGLNELYDKENNTYDFTNYSFKDINELISELKTTLEEIRLNTIDELEREIIDYKVSRKVKSNKKTKQQNKNNKVVLKSNSVSEENNIDNKNEIININNDELEKMNNLIDAFNKTEDKTDIKLIIDLNNQYEIVHNKDSNIDPIDVIKIDKKIIKVKQEIIKNLYIKLENINSNNDSDVLKKLTEKLINKTGDFFSENQKEEISNIVDLYIINDNLSILNDSILHELNDVMNEKLNNKIDSDIQIAHKDKLNKFAIQINDIYNSISTNNSVKLYNNIVDNYYKLNQYIIHNDNLINTRKSDKDLYNYNDNNYTKQEIISISKENFKEKATNDTYSMVLSNPIELLAQNKMARLKASVRIYGIDKFKKNNKFKYTLYKKSAKVLAKGLYKTLTSKRYENNNIKEVCEMWIRTLAVASKKGIRIGTNKIKYDKIFTKAYEYIESHKNELSYETYNMYLNNILGIARNKKENELYDFVEKETNDEVFLNNNIDKSLVDVKYADLDNIIENKVDKVYNAEDEEYIDAFQL